MDNQAAHQLLAINRVFYRRYAADFARTRHAPWAGWERLRPTLRGREVLLDVGCGNGRFGRFWAETNAGTARHYHAVDGSLPLLREAARALGAFPNTKTRLEWRDISGDPPRHGQYPLIALLGVLHHIPGRARRARLLRSLAARLSDEGVLVLTFWRFAEDPRIRERLRPWPPDWQGRVEENDFLLPWGAGEGDAQRYCHHVDEAEERELLTSSDLQLVQAFAADGASGTLNAYRLLRRA